MQVYSSEDKDFIKNNCDRKLVINLLNVKEPCENISDESESYIQFVDTTNEEKYNKILKNVPNVTADNSILNNSGLHGVSDGGVSDGGSDSEIDFDEI